MGQHLAFHFNWLKRFEDYLKVGNYYWGYGSLHHCGDPSINPFVDPYSIKQIFKEVIIKRIIVHNDDRDYFENRCPWEEGQVYSGESPYHKLGYPDNLKEFKANLWRYKPVREIDSTSQQDTYETLIFGIQLI